MSFIQQTMLILLITIVQMNSNGHLCLGIENKRSLSSNRKELLPDNIDFHDEKRTIKMAMPEPHCSQKENYPASCRFSFALQAERDFSNEKKKHTITPTVRQELGIIPLKNEFQEQLSDCVPEYTGNFEFGSSTVEEEAEPLKTNQLLQNLQEIPVEKDSYQCPVSAPLQSISSEMKYNDFDKPLLKQEIDQVDEEAEMIQTFGSPTGKSDQSSEGNTVKQSCNSCEFHDDILLQIFQSAEHLFSLHGLDKKMKNNTQSLEWLKTGLEVLIPIEERYLSNKEELEKAANGYKKLRKKFHSLKKSTAEMNYEKLNEMQRIESEHRTLIEQIIDLAQSCGMQEDTQISSVIFDAKALIIQLNDEYQNQLKANSTLRGQLEEYGNMQSELKYLQEQNGVLHRNIEEFKENQEILSSVLKDIMSMFKVENIEFLMPTLKKIEQVVRTLPKLENFIKNLYLIVEGKKPPNKAHMSHEKVLQLVHEAYLIASEYRAMQNNLLSILRQRKNTPAELIVKKIEEIMEA